MACALKAFLLFFLALSLVQCASKSETSNANWSADGSLDAHALRLVENAKKLYIEGSYPKVVTHLESYFAIDPDADSGWMSNILFYCYLHMGNYKLAYERARALLTQSPHNAMAYTQVGLSQLWLNRPKQAVRSFQRALEFDSRSPMNHFYLSLAYEKLRNFKSATQSVANAERELGQILITNPRDVRANYGLAEVYLYVEKENARVAELIGAVEQALNSDADEDIIAERQIYQKYYLPLIQAKHLSQLGAAEESNRLLLKAVEGAPSGIQADLAEIYFYFSRNYKSMNQIDSAMSFLMRAERMDPTGPYLGKIKKLKKQYERSG